MGAGDDDAARAGARGEAALARLVGALERSTPRRRAIPGFRRAAVLVPLVAGGAGLEVVLTRRPETLRTHPGQVAFPGGKMAEGEEPLACALREAEEELALPASAARPLGALDDVLVTTGYCMTPWVARIPAGLELVPNPAEVARVFSVPLEALADPRRTRFTQRPRGLLGVVYQVPYFEWEDELIWGATGKVLLQLLELLDLRPGS